MKEFRKNKLKVRIFETRRQLGQRAGADFARAVKRLLKEKELIRVVFAAAPSQNEFLEAIAGDPSIDFSRIDAFHMDEYVGLDPRAPQAFGQFLKDRLFDLRDFHSVSLLADMPAGGEEAARAYAALLQEAPIDIVCMGIGENGHIAFNDPGVALFNDPEDVKIVELDEVCRMQQVHDGCFASLEEVPLRALTLTVPCLMRAAYHFCMVPAPTKARAALRMLSGQISEDCPCTILRTKEKSILYLDWDSSALLKEAGLC